MAPAAHPGNPGVVALAPIPGRPSPQTLQVLVDLRIDRASQPAHSGAALRERSVRPPGVGARARERVIFALDASAKFVQTRCAKQGVVALVR